MIDKELIKRIVSYAEINDKDKILEIGAGLGKLTKEIKNKNLTIIEKDPRFIKSLNIKFKDIKIIQGDILGFKIEGYDKIIGNLPYNLTEALFWKLIWTDFNLVVFTVPKTFGEKLTNRSNKLGFVSSYFFEVKIKEDVNRKSFDPKPRTKSCVIVIKPIKKDSFMKNIFSQHDKKLKKALRETFVLMNKMTKKQADEKVLSLDLTPSLYEKRVRNLSYDEIVKLEKVSGERTKTFK